MPTTPPTDGATIPSRNGFTLRETSGHRDSSRNGRPAPAGTVARESANPSPRIRNIGDELALRAGLDPTWDAVLAVYIAGSDWTGPMVRVTADV